MAERRAKVEDQGGVSSSTLRNTPPRVRFRQCRDETEDGGWRMEDGGGQAPHLDCAMVTWWYRTPPPSPPLPLEQGLHHLVLAPPTLQRQHISHTSIPGNHGLHPRLPCSNRPQTLLWKPTTRLGVRHIDHPGSVQLAPRVSDGRGAAYTGRKKRGERVVTVRRG